MPLQCKTTQVHETTFTELERQPEGVSRSTVTITFNRRDWKTYRENGEPFSTLFIQEWYGAQRAAYEVRDPEQIKRYEQQFGFKLL